MSPSSLGLLDVVLGIVLELILVEQVTIHRKWVENDAFELRVGHAVVLLLLTKVDQFHARGRMGLLVRRHVGRKCSGALNLVEIDVISQEEGMLLNPICCFGDVSEAQSGIRVQQASHQALGMCVKVLREMEVLVRMDDLLENFFLRVRCERRFKAHHLENDHTKRLVVYSLIVPLREDHLGCNVVGRAAQCICAILEHKESVTGVTGFTGEGLGI